MRTGQAVTFRVDAFPEEVFAGTVSQIRLQPVVEQNVVSYVTVIDVPNDDELLKPGMTSTVSIQVDRAADTLRVPAAALRFTPTEPVLKEFPAASVDPAVSDQPARRRGARTRR